MNKPVTALEVYNYIEYELKAQKVSEAGELKLGTNEDEDFEEVTNCVTWRYKPTTETGLDADFYYDDNGFIRMTIGPVERYFIEFANANELKKQLLKTILMVLNGQLKIVLTYQRIKNIDQYQAGELYLCEPGKKPMLVYVISNHTRSTQLTATTLSNSETIDRQIIPDTFWLLPEKTNGKYPKGRSINLEAPEPLTRTAYKKLDESLTIQALGGEPDEPFWSYFYRTTEFWLVTIPFFLFDIWLIETFLSGSGVLNEIIKVCIHLANTAIVLFLTSILLKRRQSKLDTGNIPLFERTEDRITLLGISRVLAVASVFTLLFAPMWTPADDYTNLFPGIQYIFMYPMIFVGCIAMFAPLFFNKTGKFWAKLVTSIIYIGGIVLIFTANTLYMNNSETAPQPAIQWMILGLFIPVMIAIWMLYKTFATPNPRDKRSWL